MKLNNLRLNEFERRKREIIERSNAFAETEEEKIQLNEEYKEAFKKLHKEFPDESRFMSLQRNIKLSKTPQAKMFYDLQREIEFEMDLDTCENARKLYEIEKAKLSEKREKFSELMTSFTIDMLNTDLFSKKKFIMDEREQESLLDFFAKPKIFKEVSEEELEIHRFKREPIFNESDVLRFKFIDETDEIAKNITIGTIKIKLLQDMIERKYCKNQ